MFLWLDQSEATFNALKESVTCALFLILPNPVGDFMVCTNASLKGMGVMLTSDGRVIAYESKNK